MNYIEYLRSVLGRPRHREWYECTLEDEDSYISRYMGQWDVVKAEPIDPVWLNERENKNKFTFFKNIEVQEKEIEMLSKDEFLEAYQNMIFNT